MQIPLAGGKAGEEAVGCEETLSELYTRQLLGLERCVAPLA